MEASKGIRFPPAKDVPPPSAGPPPFTNENRMSSFDLLSKQLSVEPPRPGRPPSLSISSVPLNDRETISRQASASATSPESAKSAPPKPISVEGRPLQRKSSTNKFAGQSSSLSISAQNSFLRNATPNGNASTGPPTEVDHDGNVTHDARPDNPPDGSSSPTATLPTPHKGILRRRTTVQVAVMCPADTVSDEDLLAIYSEMLQDDKGVHPEALIAYGQMKDIPFDEDDQPGEGEHGDEGKVNRRAPLNPLASPRLGKYRKSKTTGAPKKKIVDPALKNNPLRGRLVMTLTSTAVLLFVFFQSLCYNKVFTSAPHQPQLLDTGVGRFYASFKDNGMLGPEPQVLWNLGGLNVDRIRNNGEAFRLFWAMWMHSGWIHIGFNVLSQIQYFFMFEPDWGFWKCLVTFWVAGVTGNLVSGCANPCSTTVGSSGGLFGLMGAMIPYCVEFWTTIPRPACILGFSCVVAVISLLTGFTSSTDNWAHIGGLAGGICFGLGTISSLSACRHCYPETNAENVAAPDGKKAENMVMVVVNPDGVAKKKVVKRAKFTRQVENKTKWHCGKREWFVRILTFAILAVIWAVCFTLIFSKYEYQPLGQVTYSGVIGCCCCYDTGVKDFWRCLPCKYDTGSGTTWGDACKTSMSQSKTFNLKPQYQHMSLFEALGWEKMGLETLLNEDPVVRGTPNISQQLNTLDEGGDENRLFNSVAKPSSLSDIATTRFRHPRASALSAKHNSCDVGSNSTSLSSIMPFADILPSLSHREGVPEELVRLSKLEPSPSRPNYSEYFETPLTPEDLEWLHFQEYRFQQRTGFFKDIVRRFL